MKKMSKSDFMDVIKETQLLLKSNNEWRDRYAGYTKKINDNIDFIKSKRSEFHEWSPLYLYLNVSSATNAKRSVSFELRYLGQTVANLTAKENGDPRLSTNNNLERTNQRDFGCSILCQPPEEWVGKNARKFCHFFKNREGRRNTLDNKRHDEHRLESLLLTKFSENKDKVVQNIRPVMIDDRIRFPMPTPISASNHKAVKYSGAHGGGIDILTRTGTGGRATRLCIMELKDENNKREPPKEVMKQAVAYTTFIRELLRSNTGAYWWGQFGFKGQVVPEPLELYAACVMPSDLKYNDTSFGGMKLDVDGDTIELHYLYFTEKENGRITIEPNNTTLPIKTKEP
jgi:hypothetical protein